MNNPPKKSSHDGKFSVLDLYCGLGGLSLGFELTGSFETIGGIDCYEPAVQTFYFNHPNLKSKLISKAQDITKLNPNKVLDELGKKPDVIVGGPPCQGFSHAGKRVDNLEKDERNKQVFQFLHFVEKIRPKIFLMENVSGILTTGQKTKNEVINQISKKYEEMGYVIAWKVLNSADYRVPQNRKRLILIGFKNKRRSFIFPDPPCGDENELFSRYEPYYTVEDALGDIPIPTEKDPQEYEENPKTPLQKYLRNGSRALHNHLVTKHSEEMLFKLMRQQIGTRLYPNWNHSWYRLDPKKPSPAVKENHRAPFVHYSQHRATSPRECARLQTIPDSYVLLGTKTAQLIMVGNAVPPLLSAHLATEIGKQYFDHDVSSPWTMSANPMKLMH